MRSIILVTLKGIFRDRVFHGIIAVGVLFLFVPAASSLSMRQVTELSTTLSLSLISFLLLLLSVFLGGASLWKDMERRYTYSVLGLPVTRTTYLIGKFLGTAIFLFVTTLLLTAVTCVVVWYASGIYPAERPLVWSYLLLAIFYDFLKYVLLVAVAFLFSTISTSFFLPIFGAISTFLVGSAAQEAYDFIHTPTGQKLPYFVKTAASALYYLLPNFSAFNLSLNATYGIKPSFSGLLLTGIYFVVYTTIVLFLATVVFSRREMK